jgi:hypothetical protein
MPSNLRERMGDDAFFGKLNETTAAVATAGAG